MINNLPSLVVTIVCLLGAAQSSALSLEDYVILKKQADPADYGDKGHLARIALNYYLQGIAESQISSEAISSYINRGVENFSRFGCLNENLKADADLVRDMVDKYIYKARKEGGDMSISVGLAYVAELNANFPCSKKDNIDLKN